MIEIDSGSVADSGRVCAPGAGSGRGRARPHKGGLLMAAQSFDRVPHTPARLRAVARSSTVWAHWRSASSRRPGQGPVRTLGRPDAAERRSGPSHGGGGLGAGAMKASPRRSQRMSTSSPAMVDSSRAGSPHPVLPRPVRWLAGGIARRGRRDQCALPTRGCRRRAYLAASCSPARRRCSPTGSGSRPGSR